MNRIALIFLVLISIGCSEEECIAPDGDNSPPEFIENPDTFVFVGDTLTLDVIATDPDDDSIIYHMVIHESQNNPPGYPNFDYNSDTGIFNYYPTMDDHPGSDFHYIAIDNYGGIDTTSIDIEVINPNGQYQISFANCPSFGVWIFIDGEYQGLASSVAPTIFQRSPGTYELYARSNAAIGNTYYCWTITEMVLEMNTVTPIQLDCTGAECQD